MSHSSRYPIPKPTEEVPQSMAAALPTPHEAKRTFQPKCNSRHGLSGRIVVLPTEDMEVYKAFSKELADSLNPITPMERQLAQTVADSQWRLNRARTDEDGMLALGHSEESGNFDAASPEIHSALTAARGSSATTQEPS